MHHEYLRQLAWRLRADALCWQHEDDNLAKATAHLEREAAQAIDELLRDCNEEAHDGSRSRQV